MPDTSVQIIHRGQHIYRHSADELRYKNADLGDNIRTVRQALDALNTSIQDIDVSQLQQDVDDIEDYLTNLTASQVEVVPSGNLSSTDVQAGLEELQSDIDDIDAFLDGLTAAVVLKGTWSAGSGTFPGLGLAQAGWTFIVSTGGTVDGVSFNVNDRIMAITDNASEDTFADNWFKLDYTDQVLSVNGKTGAVVINPDDLDDTLTTHKFATAAEKTKLGFISVTQAVDLDTIETNSNASKVKTDFITVTQAVNLDTMESELAGVKTKTDNISVTQAVNLDTMESDLAGVKTKTDNITVTQAVDLDVIETNSNASKTKTDFIAVTQNVDLDQIESDTVTNNAKVSNATHTGEVTGSGALAVQSTAITNKSSVTPDVLDSILLSDQSDSGNLKKATVQSLVTLALSGLGTMSTQNANAVAITGGSITNALFSGTLNGDVAGDGYFLNGMGGISGIGEIRTNDNAIISTGTGVGDVFYLAAYDTDGALDTVFMTFTAGTTPTCNLSTTTTIGGNSFYYENGPLVALEDGGTGAALIENGVDNFVRLGAGETEFTLVEIDSNYGSSNPTFSNVNTTTINNLTAPTGGLYTPTYTNVANVNSFGTVSDLAWYRIGNWVTLFGRVSIDPTSASVNTEFRFTIPVASNFTLFTDVGGSCICVSAAGLSAGARADTVNDQITIKYINTSELNAQDFSLHVSYRVH